MPPAGPANIIDLGTQTGVERTITRNLDAEGLGALRADMPPPGSRGGADDIAGPMLSDASAPITGAGLEAIKSVKNLGKVGDDIVDNIYDMAGVTKNAQPVARGNARDFLNTIKDMEDPD